MGKMRYGEVEMKKGEDRKERAFVKRDLGKKGRPCSSKVGWVSTGKCSRSVW
jgi:hypothetical protein